MYQNNKEKTPLNSGIFMDSDDDSNNNKSNLFWFYGISTIVGYLMPNPVFTYVVHSISFQTFLYRHLKLP